MAAAIGLRADFTADDLRRLAKASGDAGQTRRLLALAAIYEGALRTHAARIGGVDLQTVRDWVLRFNADGPGGLIDRKAPGKRPLLHKEQRAALVAAVKARGRPGPQKVRQNSSATRRMSIFQVPADSKAAITCDRVTGESRLDAAAATARIAARASSTLSLVAAVIAPAEGSVPPPSDSERISATVERAP